MIRRILGASVLAACTGLVSLAAQPVTFVLRNGDRVSGELTYKGGTVYTLNGRDYPSDDIAMIAFVPGDPTASELGQIPQVDNNPVEHERHVFVTRDGQVIFGKIYHISADGSVITYDRRGGGRHDIAAGNLARVYVNPAGARSVYANVLHSQTATTNAVATAGAMTSVTVPGNQRWVDTNLNVRKGESLAISATGQITVASGGNAEFVATPDGSASMTAPRNGYPIPGLPVGALIGRVGNGTPFGIGSNNPNVGMPANGRLFLGVNDSVLEDNSGAFAVTIRRQ